MESVKTSLNESLRKAKERLSKMTSIEREDMYRRQRDGWVISEIQWAKDFREGKCERD